MAVAAALSDLFTGFAERPAMADPTRSQLTFATLAVRWCGSMEHRDVLPHKPGSVHFSGPGIVQHPW
jgi:hypothetical protein